MCICRCIHIYIYKLKNLRQPLTAARPKLLYMQKITNGHLLMLCSDVVFWCYVLMLCFYLFQPEKRNIMIMVTRVCASLSHHWLHCTSQTIEYIYKMGHWNRGILGLERRRPTREDSSTAVAVYIWKLVPPYPRTLHLHVHAPLFAMSNRSKPGRAAEKGLDVTKYNVKSRILGLDMFSELRKVYREQPFHFIEAPKYR